MGYLRSGYGVSGGHLGTSPGSGLEGSIWGQFWVNSRVNSGSILGNLSNNLRIAFIWPWVGSLRLNMTNIGVLGLAGWVPGIAPLPATHPYHHPGYTPASDAVPGTRNSTAARWSRGVNMVVGLKSVCQLSLCVQISGFQDMTEVYNLIRIGRINNH